MRDVEILSFFRREMSLWECDEMSGGSDAICCKGVFVCKGVGWSYDRDENGNEVS
jgi:hypothetical protein